MINQLNSGDLLIFKKEKKPFVNIIDHVYEPSVTVIQNIKKTDKNIPELPAPFYDELHFANYE